MRNSTHKQPANRCSYNHLDTHTDIPAIRQQPVNIFSIQIAQLSVRYLMVPLLFIMVYCAAERIILNKSWPIHIEWLLDESWKKCCYCICLLSASCFTQFTLCDCSFTFSKYRCRIISHLSCVLTNCWQPLII